MSDLGQVKQTLELYAQKQPDNPLLDVCFALLDMVHELQHEVKALRAENQSLRQELRQLNESQKTPRERVKPTLISPVFEPIRQEILQAIRAKEHEQTRVTDLPLQAHHSLSIEDQESDGMSIVNVPLNRDVSTIEASFEQENQEHEQAQTCAHDFVQEKDEEGKTEDQAQTQTCQGDQPKPRRSSTGRRKIPVHLPCQVVTAMPEDLPEGARFIRFENSSRLGYRTGGLYRLELRRAVFSTPQDEASPASSVVDSYERADPCSSQTASGVTIAPRFEELLVKGLPTPDLLSYVVHSKFGLHLPLNRIEQETERMGFRVARATLCGWLLQLHPWIDRLSQVWQRDGFEHAPYVATDATSVKVLAKERCKNGYFWTIIVGGLYVFYRFTAKHNKITVNELLGNYRGTILADGAMVFNILFESEDLEMDTMLRAGCWAHARRYFIRALRTGGEFALQALGFVNMLFEFERDWVDLDAKTRLSQRLQRSQPVIDRLDQWRREISTKVEPGSELARAMTYLNNQWDPLGAFLRDGSVPISNNDSERNLRRLVLGRLNWLFVGHERAGQAAANYASLIATCQMHGVDAALYLRDLFRVLPHWPQDRYLELAPHRWLATKAQINETCLSWPLGPLPIPPKIEDVAKKVESETVSGDLSQ